MANPEHVEILKQGVEVWNKWREKNPLVVPDLSGVRVTGDDRSQIDPELEMETDYIDIILNFLENMDVDGLNDLAGINLSNSLLEYSAWHDIDFSDADFSQSSLYGAHFFECSFENAILAGSDLGSIELKRCELGGANFNLCSCHECSFTMVDLSNVKGLENVYQFGPSSISLDTIFLSKGQIPKSFLRGCGVPEEFINQIPKLVSQTSDYFTCFISHSTLDSEFCDRLHADVQNKGVRAWYFRKDARTGRDVWSEINKPINEFEKLMVVCSENSLKSGPVLREIERALQREDREHKHILFPIRIDDYIFDEWEHPRKADVIAKVVGDFSNWKDHDSYQKALDRLMRDLKASEE